MRSLDRKLIRDRFHLRGQVAEIVVTQGLSNSFEAVVETGLVAGDMVIAYPESVEVGDLVEGL